MPVPLILIPGLGSDDAVWRPTIDALGPASDCRIGDTFSDDSLPGMAARILAAAPPRFALAGISMGGMVAMEIMRAAPDRIDRLALLDTNPDPDSPEQTARRRQINAAMQAATDLAAMCRMSFATLIHPDAVNRIGEDLIAMTIRVGAPAYIRQNQAVAAREDQRPILSTIAVPSIVVVGAEDRMTPPTLAATIAGAIPGATLHAISDCGHLPPIERPIQTAAILKTWLA